MRFSLSTFLALGAFHTFGVYAQDCINTCVENVKPNVGCADPADASCVCVSSDFVKGVAECARGPECAAADDAITNSISNGFCVGQQVPALPDAAATTPTEGAATSEPAAVTSETPVASETTGAETSPAALPESSEAPVTSEAAATSEAPEATPTNATDPAESSASAEASTEASASSTAADNSSATSEAGGAATTSDSAGNEDKEEESAGGGMSGGAKAGVGIGVTIAILALLGVAGFFFWRKRQNQHNLPRGNMDDISPPMAARDRSYPAPDQGSIGEKNGYDLELMSHRYEDMLPREEPRHMV
ncbi:hypothetical protein FLONG3_3125 [Fusarium longipes]|uniref:CFEM domain-containing protein n=1 Tax=Fusarium longipes TaxID=694270 RepID=A0A395T262_9HYPO|nr:hypothetical protein FLONG3_3125 [Fusarium longipes]